MGVNGKNYVRVRCSARVPKLLAAVLVFGCACFDVEPERELDDRVWSVGAYAVHQRKVRESAGWMDATYRRELRAWVPGQGWIDIGTVRDEANVGVQETAPPTVVDGRLVVFVASTTFVVSRDGDVVRVSPYDVADFESLGVNGHYDLLAKRFSSADGRWRIELESRGSGDDTAFESLDDGGTWRVPRARGRPTEIAPDEASGAE